MNPILVTGGAKGIGREVCLTLSEKGHDVVVHYNKSEKEADALIKKCRSFGVNAEKIHGDFSSEHSLDQFIEKYLTTFEKTKGLVNNVGNYLVASSLETKKKEWQALIQTNLIAAIFLTQALIPKIERAQGSIVNLGVNGIIHAKSKAPAYHVTKVGLWGYTLCLSKELAPKGITVNMVSPGFTERSVDIKPSENLPMKRPATLKEIAHAVAFLFENESHYITGQNIEISGGFGL